MQIFELILTKKNEKNLSINNIIKIFAISTFGKYESCFDFDETKTSR